MLYIILNFVITENKLEIYYFAINSSSYIFKHFFLNCCFMLLMTVIYTMGKACGKKDTRSFVDKV